MKLEDIKVGATITGILANSSVKIIAVTPMGEVAVQVVFQTPEGTFNEKTCYRDEEYRLGIVEQGRPWSFVGEQAEIAQEGQRFKLAAEAQRIQLAHLFDPLMAVHSSAIDPLPHQITAVYESMLPKQPLRFLLADDPGSGKTIMAGLLIRELMVRGDVKRCLIVAPGSLSEQWQDEMSEKFGINFEVFSRSMIDASQTGNPFEEKDLLIARIDQISRAEDLREKLKRTDWDIIVVDEAHKMSAHWFGGKLNKTKRYQLGEMLGDLCRHYLLMTATPHNGKEQDFQTFLGLLDSDRFYGQYRDGVHKVDTTDLMRRMVKEDLLKFDGTPLFPERIAYSVNYKLSPLEGRLYEEVTEYVRHEMNRANEVEGKRRTVGFALTILQRRLASSPEAIYQSLKRRSKKLSARIQEAKQNPSGLSELTSTYTVPNPDEIDDYYEDATDTEIEELEDEVVDQATAARTIEELKAEIVILGGLTELAEQVVHTREDRKWKELSQLLTDNKEMFDSHGSRRKIIIFTEHKDTLNYLYDNVASLPGLQDAVVTIHGGVTRENRKKAQELFTQDKNILVMIATDAAGEGVNLQRASLMVNYDLPWNPNRMEQRFGRIHRIGQTEICHLWNLVAGETREGAVFQRLLEKLDNEREALGGKVFDVLGELFEQVSLRDLLIEAIQYGDDPDVQARLHQKVDGVFDHEHIEEIINRNALATDHMDTSSIYRIKEEMEKAEALKLQPFFIRAFFEEAFGQYGGQLKKRGQGRFEITHVPADVRSRNRVIGKGQPVLQRYERICFQKDKIRVDGKPMAAMIAPGHPLMESLVDLVLENERNLLKQGSILVDHSDEGIVPHLMFMVTHSVRDAVKDDEGKERIISKRMQFVMVGEDGEITVGGHAPYLDYEPLQPDEFGLVSGILEKPWIVNNQESLVILHAVNHLAPGHLGEVKDRRIEKGDRTLKAVRERLTVEINHWAARAEQLKIQAEAGKQLKMNWENASRRAKELTVRLQQRESELEAERHITSSTPLVLGGALIIPQGLLDQKSGKAAPQWAIDTDARKKVEMAAMDAVMEAERALGFDPQDVSAEKYGWDVQSRAGDGDVRFIEVKGRAKGATTVTVTKNEILASFNQPERFVLAICQVDGDQVDGPYYIREPFESEPDFGITSINFDMSDLLAKAQPPN